MSNIKQQLTKKFDALSSREKVLVLLSTLVAVLVVWFLLVSDPLYNKTRQASTQLESIEKNVLDLKRQYQSLQQRKNDEPNRGLKQRIAQLDQHMKKVDLELREKFHGLIEPEQMARVLESVVQRHRNLKLIRVRSLEAVPLITPDENVDEDKQGEEKQVEVYRHGMQVEFEGNFIATLDYLKALEKLDWEFYWDAVQLEVEDYPRSRIIITVHTLSLRDAWIGV